MAEIDSQTAGLIANLIIGIPITLICLFLFDLFRRKVPSVFEARRTLHSRRQNLDYFGNRVFTPAAPSNRFLGWVIPVIRLELDTIAVTHGLDTSLYLRYLRSMASLFLVMCIPSAVLLPIFYTASNKDLPDDDQARTVGVQSFSLANVDKDDSWRFWVVVAVEFLVLILILALLLKEFAVYSKHRRRYRSTNSPANYAILVQDIPTSSSSEKGVREYWEKLFPGEVASVYFIHDGQKLVQKKAMFWDAVTRRERAIWDKEFNEKLGGKSPTHKVGRCSCCKGSSAAVDSIEYWSERQNHYANKITLYQQEVDPKHFPSTHSAVVVFYTRRAAAVAAQTNFAVKENEWRVSRAPEPNAVNWKSLGIPGKQVPFRNFLTILFAMLLTLFWIIPVTFIMGLVNLNQLANVEIGDSKPFSFLSDVANWSPALTAIIQSLLPAIILSVFLSLIPTFLRMFISVSRVASMATVDNLVRDWYFNFVIFSNFLFVIVSGSLLEKLEEIIANPGSTVDFLAESIPKQGAFIMNFILLKALSETPQQILQIGRVAVRWIMLKFVARTPRQKSKVETGNTVFTFFRYYAIAQLIALLGIIYSTIAPFIVPICFVYFAMMYIVWKYNLCFSMHNPYQDGGRMYGGALYALWIGLFLHLLTMIGILGLNKNPAQSALITVPAIIAIVFLMQCRKSYNRIVCHGSALETQLRVEEDEGVDKISDELAEKYIHPGFEPLPDPIEDLSGVGGNTGEGKHDFEDDLEDPEPPSDVVAGEMPPVKFSGNGDEQSNSKSTEEWKDAYGTLQDQ